MAGPVAYYPRSRVKWDYRTQTIRLDRLDAQIAHYKQPNNSLSAAFGEDIATWDDSTDIPSYYLLPMDAVLQSASKPLQLRAIISLSCLWQIREGHRAKQLGRRYRGRQLYATTSTGDISKHALRYMPRLTPHQLACLCYPADMWQHLTRENIRIAKTSLRKLDTAGHIAIITATSKHWQIAKPYTPPWC